MARVSIFLAFAALMAGCAGPAAQSEPVTADSVTPVAQVDETDYSQYPDDDGTETLASTRESNQVWGAIRRYLTAHQDLANTFDIPGDEFGPALLDTFHAVHRESGHFVTCVDFRDSSHTFDVDFIVTGAPEFAVQESTLHRVDSATLASN